MRSSLRSALQSLQAIERALENLLPHRRVPVDGARFIQVHPFHVVCDGVTVGHFSNETLAVRVVAQRGLRYTSQGLRGSWTINGREISFTEAALAERIPVHGEG